MADDPNTDPTPDPPESDPDNNDESNWTRLAGIIESAVDKAVTKKWEERPGTGKSTNISRTGSESKPTRSWLEKLISGD